MWFGGMWQSKKALDLLRDPRFALHSASLDAAEWKGDAKIADHIVIEFWREGQGVQRVERQ